MKIVKIKQNLKDVVMHETTKVDKNVKSWKKCFGPVKPVRWTSRYKLPCVTNLEPIKPVRWTSPKFVKNDTFICYASRPCLQCGSSYTE